MTPPAQSGVARPEIVTEEIPRERPGWIEIATSGDHKVVGRMYVAASLTFLAAAATLLALMRIQLIVPDATIIRPEIFNQLLSAYGVAALLLFAVPLLLGLFCFVVPLQIGAREVALPRLNALSFWLYLAGALAIYGSFLYTPSEAGTMALPPLSDQLFSASHGVDMWAIGVGLIVLGYTLFAINLLATVRGHRAPGMVWRRLPLFSVGATVSSWVLLIAAPIMLAAVSMLLIDRNFDGIFFQAGEGGAPLLYEHLGFIFFTGAYVVVVVAAAGAISEILATFSRQPQFGHRTIAGSLVAFAVLGVLAWMQNMYSAPIPIGFLYFAMLMAVALVVPMGLILFNWIATLRGGTASMRPPLLFAVGAIALLSVGLAGEWAQSVIPVSWQVAETGVGWGDTHLVLIGAGLLGGFAALHYWFPKMTGHYMGRSLARASFWAIVAGTVLMVVPIQLAGLEGMPVDVYKFYGDTGISAYNLIASLGAFLLVDGIILTLVNAAASRHGGTPAGHDPWGGSSLEWFALSPPPVHNFDLVPDVRSNEPYRDIREAVAGRSTRIELPAAAAAGSGVAPPVGATGPPPETEAISAPESSKEPDGASDTGQPEDGEADGPSSGDEDDGPVA